MQTNRLEYHGVRQQSVYLFMFPFIFCVTKHSGFINLSKSKYISPSAQQLRVDACLYVECRKISEAGLVADEEQHAAKKQKLILTLSSN